MKLNEEGMQKISTANFLAADDRSTHDRILTCSRLQRERMDTSGVSAEKTLISASALPYILERKGT